MSLLIRAMPRTALLRASILKSQPCLSALAKRESSTGNHTPLWTAERAVSAALIGVTPLALAMPNPATNFLLSLALTAHIHWGMEAIAVDYVRARVVGSVLPKLAMGAVYGLSFATLGGLMYFNFTDVGLANAILMFWKL
ncbi:succinate dehydrogenase [ubiquinone] cytochrome b small subunit, mitochondrial [Galendromus occidentalis]|uniref:Succinate dehydrogenase [ubiquinone] cytochrome b small subunit n=1 Tax=Galendromus occidentalis TaxID=34638 RepID=A0AAJ6QR38_9ACAR|nr:succinate dehydrogenase [ubiquinone] cytochrome b small subunit, mitochondrial [Galendromus occidentalis]